MKNNGPDLTKINNMPRSIRVEIASKIEKRINEEIGEYNHTKNSEYKKICEEVGSEYGITESEAAVLYYGWKAHKRTSRN